MPSPSAGTPIDAYIAGFPPATRAALAQLRSLIRDAAPAATETISYAIPTFDLCGKHLVHFAGYDEHIGFYPTPTTIAAFRDELTRYRPGKGSVRFPLSEEVPWDLIQRMVAYRVAEVASKATDRPRRRSSPKAD